MNDAKIEFPEHEKMEKKKKEIALLVNFVSYLNTNKNLRICKKDNVTGEFYSIYEPIEKFIADYFYIDLEEIEKEKSRMKIILDTKKAE